MHLLFMCVLMDKVGIEVKYDSVIINSCILERNFVKKYDGARVSDLGFHGTPSPLMDVFPLRVRCGSSWNPI